MDVHLVDGTYELFRYHYNPANKDDRHGATKGVLSSMLDLVRGGATHVGIATDHVITSFRNDMYDDYKDGSDIDPQLHAQFPEIEDALRAAGFTVFPMVEYEADDGMAAAAVAAEKDPAVDKVIICTPDKDLGQCVRADGRIVQYDRRKQLMIDQAGIIEKFGVPPESIPDYLGLVGDTADGFPGLPGWGAKSTATLLAKYGHIQNIPPSSDDWQVKVRGAVKLAVTLRENYDDALLFRKIATVITDIDLFGSVDEMRWDGPTPAFEQIARDLGQVGLWKRAVELHKNRRVTKEPMTVSLRPVSPADLGALLPMNNAAVPAVSHLEMPALEALVDQAEWFTVVESEGEIAGFLIGMHGPGLPYASVNYREFCRRFPDGFWYVDRIVVSPDHRNKQIGATLYDAFAKFGRASLDGSAIGGPRICAEVNVRPRNDGSLRFHRRFGFRPIGELDYSDDGQRVSLLAYDLTDGAAPLDRHHVVDVTAKHDPDLAQRLEFVFDLDRLKTVQRMSLITDGSRRENTAEHSWHIAMVAIACAPTAAEPISIDRVIEMLLVHDIVEADAGDVYIYDELTSDVAAASKSRLETEAARRIFGLLPNGEGDRLRELWEEYEGQTSADARFAKACDRIQPFLLNAANGGKSWTENNITASQVRHAMSEVKVGAPRLVEMVERLIAEQVAIGHLPEGSPPT